MIISHIIGGLGNQMFQYATARALSLKRGTPLFLDVQDFAGYKLHNGYELDRIFALEASLASRSELKAVLGWRAYSIIRRRLFRNDLIKFRGAHLFVDTQFKSWREIHAVPDNCYLMGNWQTEKYFDEYRQTILNDFTFIKQLDGLNLKVADAIKTTNAISLHVRRGDYVSNASSLAFHGVCSLEYYRKAIEFMVNSVHNPTFFIFSDDMQWVRENITLEYPCTFVDFNTGSNSYNDMHLMSLCKHHIIANSSFSWWGAWLNRSERKIVIAPQQWFAADFDSSNIIPSEWIKL